VIGRTKDTVLGRCKVESVELELAIAQPTQGAGFQKGDRFDSSQEMQRLQTNNRFLPGPENKSIAGPGKKKAAGSKREARGPRQAYASS
jgi:hypothetical protein